MPAPRATLTELPHGTAHDTVGPFREKLYDCSKWLQSTIYKEIATNKDEWEIVDPADAKEYLPESRPPRKIKLGIKEQHDYELNLFESASLNETMKYKLGHVFNAGTSVWGLGFAPKNPLEESQSSTQYLAVAGYKGTEEESHHFSDVQPRGTYKNCIQIWRLELTVQGERADPVLDMCILHDCGIVKDLKWCPYGAYEESTTCELQWLPKLGILAVSFGDDTAQMIVVPHPRALREHLGQSPDDHKQTVYLRLKKSRAYLSIPGAAPTCVAWGGPKRISVGYDNGYIAVWDAQTILQSPDEDVEKALYSVAPIHETVVRCIAWHGYDDPTQFVSCGNDSHIKLTDYRDPFVNVTLQRSRTTSLFEIAFMGFDEAICYQDSDKSIRSQLVRFTAMSQGTKQTTGKTTMMSMAGSEMHPFYLLGFADGWVHKSNLHYIKERKAVECHFAYKLDYDEERDVYRYIDGIPWKTIEQITKDIPTRYIPNRRLAIQKAVWCPNAEQCGWAATAGANGLCRVEFLGRGTEWK